MGLAIGSVRVMVPSCLFLLAKNETPARLSRELSGGKVGVHARPQTAEQSVSVSPFAPGIRMRKPFFFFFYYLFFLFIFSD